MIRRALFLAAALCAPFAAAEEIWHSGSTQLFAGAELTGTYAPHDRGFFDYTDYGQNVLRQARLTASMELRMGDRFGLLGEVMTENRHHPRVYALYVRVRPLPTPAFDLQAGVIPPVFGRFPRSGYASDNPLIGYPLAYQYLTTMRPDVVLPGAADLLGVRGSGWLVGYGSGDWEYAAGLPVAAARRWDTGIQARVGTGRLQGSVALTQGTLANPRIQDDNDGKQLSARVAWRPCADLSLGFSGARGEYLSSEAQESLPAAFRDRTFRQRAAGVDAEYARGHWRLRGESIWTSWDAAAEQAPLAGETLDAWSWYLETRFVPFPGAHIAARVEALDFGDIEGPTGPEPWEARVWRLEAGVGYSITRHVSVKVSYQRNRRDGGFVHGNDLVAVQGTLWY